MQMKMEKYKAVFLILIFLSLLSFKTEAQTIARQTIGSYGSSGTINGASFSQTIGQPYATNIYGESGFRINPGFQQSGYFASLGDKQENKEEKNSLKKEYYNLEIYPNPAKNKIHVSTRIEKGFLEVFNMQGRRILTKKNFYTSSKPINCTNWTDGAYMILIYDKTMNKHYKAKVLISK